MAHFRSKLPKTEVETGSSKATKMVVVAGDGFVVAVASFLPTGSYKTEAENRPLFPMPKLVPSGCWCESQSADAARRKFENQRRKHERIIPVCNAQAQSVEISRPPIASSCVHFLRTRTQTGRSLTYTQKCSV